MLWSLAGAVLLSGCLSIPISTLYKMARMSDDDLKAMDPTQFRTAVELPANVPIDPAKILVGFCFRKHEKDEGGEGGIWPIQLVRQGRFVTAGLPTVPEDRTLYLFQLSDDAQTRLAAILAKWRADKNAYEAVTVDIDASGSGDAPPDVKVYRTSSWFQIATKEGFLQLLDDYQVDVEKELKDHAGDSNSSSSSLKNCH